MVMSGPDLIPTSAVSSRYADRTTASISMIGGGGGTALGRFGAGAVAGRLWILVARAKL
jgi:hypothetical protein